MEHDPMERLRLSDAERESIERDLQVAVHQRAAGTRAGSIAEETYSIEWSEQGTVVRTVAPETIEAAFNELTRDAAGLIDGPLQEQDLGPLTERVDLSWRKNIAVARGGLERKQRAPRHAAVRRYLGAAENISKLEARARDVSEQLDGLPARPERRLLRRPEDPYADRRVQLQTARRDVAEQTMEARRIRDEAASVLKRHQARNDPLLRAEVRDVEQALRELDQAGVRIAAARQLEGRAHDRDGSTLGLDVGV